MTVRQQLPKLLIAMALTLSIGAHWALLQSVAWAGMLYSYSQDAGLAEAVTMTFDGEHPCTLCTAIEDGQGKERDKDSQATQVAKDLKLGMPLANFILLPPIIDKAGLIELPQPGVPPEQPDAPPPQLPTA